MGIKQALKNHFFGASSYREPVVAPKKVHGGVVGWLETYFHIYDRGSTWFGEIRAGLVLFMVSAYILFLNPLILSGGSSGTITGMPSEDVVLATAISTGLATMLMGVVANYPWVVSVQLGTNVYFVTSVLQPFQPCGAHSHFTLGNDICSGQPCTCAADGSVLEVGTQQSQGPCFGTQAACLGTKIPYEQALAATFLEGIVFLLICFTGMRTVLLRCFPKVVLMAGAAGIGLFIAAVGIRGMQLIVAAPYPNLSQFATTIPYGPNGITNYKASGVGFNDCVMYFQGAPYSAWCPWLSIGGLVFTGILLLWNVNGAFIFGILFTTFISWIKFPDKIGEGGLVPPKGFASPKFRETAGALSFDWGDNTGKLIEAWITFLYLDFIGSSITFVSMGTMCSILDEHGNIPKSNVAFIADGFGSTMGGLLGTSALTTYVESAAAVREGGRTGITAIVCSVFFFLSIFMWPIFSNIPDIATSPILVLIGVLIFISAVFEIEWSNLSDAIPAFITMLGIVLANNIAYGCIAGIIAYIMSKFFTYQLHPIQQSWPGYNLYQSWTKEKSLKLDLRAEGWITKEEAIEMRKAAAAGAMVTPDSVLSAKDDDTAHGGPNGASALGKAAMV